MITDRYDPMNLFELVPKLSLEMEPELVELDRLLEDDSLFQRVKADLSRRYPNSAIKGRHSTPVEVLLRMLVVRRLYDWSYEETEHFVSDSLVLRQFCRLYLQKAPDHSTLDRWAALIGPETLERLNEHVVGLAKSLKVTRGRKLRSDGSPVETNVHHPSDSSLLFDGVRVLSRIIGRAKAVMGQAMHAGEGLFRNRTRSAKRLSHEIGNAARRRGEEAERAMRNAYQRLIGVAEATLRQARLVRDRLAETPNQGAFGLARQIEHFLPLVGQVASQARRRVLLGEAVAAGEKVISIFEPHTTILPKPGRETKFGRKVWIDEVDGGIVSGYRVLAGNPGDDSQLLPALEHHTRLFGKVPKLFAADRGVHSPKGERTAQEMGVRQVALPRPGRKSPERERYEQQGWFRRGMRFRAGIEGRISVLKRRGYLGRCRDRGEEGFERWIGWGVLTANLSTIARAVASR
jgi:IS5 family transposase